MKIFNMLKDKLDQMLLQFIRIMDKNIGKIIRLLKKKKKKYTLIQLSLKKI
jgi:hypothetical protein